MNGERKIINSLLILSLGAAGLHACVNKVENGKTYVDKIPYGLIEKGQKITVEKCGPKHAGGPGVDGEMVDVCDVKGSLLPIPKGIIRSNFSPDTP